MKKSTRYAIALTAALGLVMGVLDNTIINIALVPISRALHVELNIVQWLVTGYFLAQAAVIPIAGYLSTRFGRKLIFLLCIGLFTVGSFLCGLAQDATLLIIFRIIQGIGAGALFPVAQAIALDPFPAEERAGANAIIGIPILLGPVFGPILGGWINDSFGWSYLFFINVPIGALAILLIWLIIPADSTRPRGEKSAFDYVGLSLSMVGVLALVYAFALVNQTNPGTVTALNPQGQSYGWSYLPVWLLVGAGLLLLLIFAIYELRFSRDPVLDLRLFKEYAFAIGSVVSWVLGMTVFGSLLLLPIFLQQVRLPHLTALQTGLLLFPQGLAAAVGIALGGPLYKRIGVRTLTAVGVVFLIVGLWQFGHLTPSIDGSVLILWNILLGFGLGLTLVPVQTLALQTISGPALAKASSLYNVTRQITSSIGTAIIISLLVQRTVFHFGELQASLAHQLPPGVVPNPNDPQVARLLEQAHAQAGTAANNDVFIILSIATVLLLLVSMALPGRRRTAELMASQPQAAQEAVVSIG